MFKDVNGRVPFSVIGAIIMIGSAITTNFVIVTQHELADNIFPDASDNLKHFIQAAEADMKRELAYAGIYAFSIVGKSPVTQSSINYYPGAEEYIKEAEKFSKSKDNKIDTLDEIMEFNKNWARSLIKYKFNEYLVNTFFNNRYSNGEYAINVVLNDKGDAVGNWKMVELIPVKAKIKRTIDFSWLIGDKNVEYTEYWEARIKSLKIDITNVRTGTHFIKEIELRTLIPSRLPFLMELTNFYNKSINGVLSPLNGIATAVSMGYTEARALMKYGGGDITNIVANSWLQYVINMALFLVEYLVYNSIDPVSMAYLAINAKDLIANKGIESLVPPTLKDIGSQIDFKFTQSESTLTDIRNPDSDEIKNRFYEQLNKNDEGKETILKVAKDILYMPKYNNNKDINNIEERWDETNINNKVLNKISEETKDVYSAYFRTGIKRVITNEWYDVHVSSPKWKMESADEWNRIELSLEEGDKLSMGNLPDGLPHIERWKSKWRREELWLHLEKVGEDDEGKPIYEWRKYGVTHYVEEKCEFTLYATPSHPDISNVFTSCYYEGYRDDNLEYMLIKYIDNFFIDARDSELNLPPENKDYSKYSCFWMNNSMSECCDKSDINIDIRGYAIDWLLGRNGKVVKELEDIIEKIKEDVDSKYYDKEIDDKYKEKYGEGINGIGLLDEISRDADILIKKFEARKNYYLESDKYIQNNMFHSAASKVIYDIRLWFLNEIELNLKKVKNNDLEKNVNDKIKGYSGNINYAKIKNNMQNYMGFVSSLTTIQFGNNIILDGKWRENITIAISANPAYFDYKQLENKKEKWKFSVKNICVFGPFGFPVLPTPATPWVATLNVWYIEINGTWEIFKVVDASDEAIPNELFGHTGQIYQLKMIEGIKDESQNEIEIGNCTPLSFGIQTLSIGIVPPGSTGVGDMAINPEEKNP
ncbi:MAG: hypothetical protein J7K61_05690 [Thermoplasmata archaeon]|nr:hypothetical protein [Thermoplasmata archaeon]